MLKIFEIKIGNFLNFDSFPLAVTGIFIDETGARFVAASNRKLYLLRSARITPIDLDVAWLRKLNFKPFRNNHFVRDGWNQSARVDLDFENGLLSIKTRHDHRDQTQILPHIRYVHQVQNLYLSLTNHELVKTSLQSLIDQV